MQTMKIKFLILLLVFIFFSSSSFAQNATPTSAPSKKNQNWYVQKSKDYPLYKVQVLTFDDSTMPLGIGGTKTVITNKSGKILAELKNIVMEPDPRETIEAWVPGTLLDLDQDGYEDLLLRVYTGGVHCCYQYEIYSLGKVFKKLGSLKLLDCGEKIKLQDLNSDKIPEIISCNAHFIYFKDIPYSESPFPPQVFQLDSQKYTNADLKFQKVFDDDIQEQKKQLQERGYSDGIVLQIVLDYLLTGRETQGWQEFDQLIKSNKKDSIKQELQEKYNQYRGAETKAALSQPSTAW
ncbi:MAG: hypothetical protein JNK65_07435 [Deltaproteobacteria bacterium]|nr:hypothetical protein [Deltaproteobacteria bacterium]